MPSNKEVLENHCSAESDQDTIETTNELSMFKNASIADVRFVNGLKKWFVGYVIGVRCT